MGALYEIDSGDYLEVLESLRPCGDDGGPDDYEEFDDIPVPDREPIDLFS